MAGAVDYRQLQAPEQVDTSLPDSGAAARAAELRNVFKNFEGDASDYGKTAALEAGALAGAASGATGNPQYKQGLVRFSTYSKAFNNAATGAYAIQAEAQADDDAARLRIAANNDPNAFRTTFSAIRDAVLKTAPAEAVPMLTELYNKHLAAGVGAISGDQAAETVRLQRAAYDEGVSRQVTRVGTLMGSENPQDQLSGQDEQVKLSLLIDGGVNAGLYSKSAAESMHISTARQITSQVFSTQVDRELSRPPEDRDIVGLMERFRQLHLSDTSDTSKPPTLSEPEFQKLMGDATTKIREQNLLEAYNRKNEKSAEQLRFEAGDRDLTAALLNHTLTPRRIEDAVRNQDLKPERATSLYTFLLQGPQVIKSDPNALFKLHTDPDFLDYTPDQIKAYTGISATDALKAVEEQTKRKNSWEGTQASHQAQSTIAAALKIKPGTMTSMLSEAQRGAYTDATQDYIRQVNAMKPSEQQQPSMLQDAARKAIDNAQRNAAAAEADTLRILLQSQIKAHGPGTASAWDADKLQRYVDDKNKAIAAAVARSKGTQ